MIENKKVIYPALFLIIALAVTVLAYLPGLKGGFLFDDYPNLEALGAFGAVDDLESFKRFVFGGISGPLGRPISLASFLLDDNTWPSNASWFKTTNLKLHLLTSVILCWATLNLLRLYRPEQDEVSRIWIALISAFIWALHPYMVSTTLYVVQRMAQLSTLFVLAGITGYLHGRLLLTGGKIKSAYLWMTASLGLGLLLAVFSKENGILLPLLILVVEFCLPAGHKNLFRWWKWVFLISPSLAVVFMLVREINFSPDAWPTRLFTQPERLLTEPRILLEYLYYLYVPHIEGRGLFQDGFPFSRGFLSPLSTIFAFAGVLGLIIGAICLRKRFALLSFAVLFFFAGHLLESSVIGLELYFEHRNYLSAVFLFLPIAIFLIDLSLRYRPRVAVASGLALFCLLAFMTWERTTLWSNTSALQHYWAASTPESARAQNQIGSVLWAQGEHQKAISHMLSATERLPQSSFLNVSLLLMKVYNGSATVVDFTESANKMQKQAFDAQAIVGIRMIVDEVLARNNPLYLSAALGFIRKIEGHEKFVKVAVFVRVIPYLKGRLYLALKNTEMAYDQFSRAIDLYAETDAAIGMVAEMASAKHPVESLKLLKKAEIVLQNQPDNTLLRSRSEYEMEIRRFHKLIQDDIEKFLGDGGSDAKDN